MNAYNKLDSNEKILFLQVAANPAYLKFLSNQKEEIQEQLLNFWVTETASDADYRRRHEILKKQFILIKEQIELCEMVLKQT